MESQEKIFQAHRCYLQDFFMKNAYIRIWDIQTYPKVASKKLGRFIGTRWALPVISKVTTPVTHLEGHL